MRYQIIGANTLRAYAYLDSPVMVQALLATFIFPERVMVIDLSRAETSPDNGYVEVHYVKT